MKSEMFIAMAHASYEPRLSRDVMAPLLFEIRNEVSDIPYHGKYQVNWRQKTNVINTVMASATGYHGAFYTAATASAMLPAGHG